MRKHCNKLEAAKKALEDLQAKTLELEEKRKEACAELTRAQNGVVAARMATPSVLEMDLDDEDEAVQRAEVTLAKAKEESAARRRKTKVIECDGSDNAQAELEKAFGDAQACFGRKPWAA